MKTVDPLHGVAAFLAVAEHESFTAGATALGLTRATVSAQVSELEARLGVRLLHRSTRNVRLTPAGAAYRERIVDLPGRMAEAERAARAEHSAPEGRLRLTAPPDLAIRFLVPWVAEFLASHPGVSIDMELSNAPRNLIEGRYDLAIRGTLDVGPNLITRSLGQSRLVTCARADYLARRGVPAVPSDLAAHDVLHFSGLRRGRFWSYQRGQDQTEVRTVRRPGAAGGCAGRRGACATSDLHHRARFAGGAASSGPDRLAAADSAVACGLSRQQADRGTGKDLCRLSGGEGEGRDRPAVGVGQRTGVL
jgi:LysR family transcriptional regulator, regulator for bpeEF and oprC